jgi:pyrimidine operon attenuation protein/uracil phosphoribosyltransferase
MGVIPNLGEGGGIEAASLITRDHQWDQGDMPMGNEKEILSDSDIDRLLKRICSEILEAHKDLENLVFIGIQTRGVFLAKRLQAEILRLKQIEIPRGSIDITLYRDDWTRIDINPVVQDTRISFSVDGKQIILIDDVLFTGRTIRAAMDALMDFGRPDRIELFVLVDRKHRELPIQANYIGLTVATRYTDSVNVLLREHDGSDRVLLLEGDA